MKPTKITLSVGLFAIASIVFGQDFTFKVLANKGNNEVKSNNAWHPLKIGESLQQDDELKLATNAYVGLIHASGKPVELKEPGSHKVADLAAQVSGGSSVINKYTDFILSSNAEGKKNRLSATGAVHRNLEEATSINVIMPGRDDADVFNNRVVLNWETEAQGPFVVSVRNMFEDNLATLETSETGIEIDLGKPELANENALFVTVSSKVNSGQSSGQYLIKRLTPSEQMRIKSSFSEIIGEVSEPTALNNLILAGFYEENNLLIDAIVAYEDAIKFAPEVTSYEDAYNEFLLRQGLKQE